jgi:hypothetical protein
MYLDGYDAEKQVHSTFIGRVIAQTVTLLFLPKSCESGSITTRFVGPYDEHSDNGIDFTPRRFLTSHNLVGLHPLLLG